jgi:subtilisin family serine protease
LSAEETFRADLQAIRAAGIVPVFAAGNDGPNALSIHNPASYPEAIAVGATDDLDQVATFSSRGPSPWGEVKPEVAAPGVQIRSSLPGGTYGLKSGTWLHSCFRPTPASP